MSDARSAAAYLAEREEAEAFIKPDIAPPDRAAIDAGFVVARAWLAEHPADDAATVTEQWLRRSGFQPSVVYPPSLRFDFLYLAAPGKCGGWQPHVEDGARFRTLPYCRTRADVRRLCAVLGIELQSGNPEKA